MLTRCPFCHSRYRLHNGVADSHGAVFCGQCDLVFDAVRSLYDPEGKPIPVRDFQGFYTSGDRDVYVTKDTPLAEPYRELIDEPLYVPSGARPTIPADTQDSGNLRSLVSAARLALRNMLRNRRRSLFALAAISFGVIAILLAGGFIEYLLEAMRESTIHSQLGHIQVSRSGYHAGGQADPFAFLLPQRSPELGALETLDHVKVVAPRLYFSGLLSHDETTVSFTGQGIEAATETDLNKGVAIVTGNDLRPDAANQVILGVGLAHNVGVEVGDAVVVLTNTEAGSINAVELTVAGTFRTSAKAFDDSALRIHIDTARALLKAQGSHTWIVLLDDTKQTMPVYQAVSSQLDTSTYEVKPWHALADFFNKTVKLFGRQVMLVALIIGLLILLSISNTMMMNVMERTNEIGTLMAVGLKRKRIRTLFLCEGLLLGFLGGLLGAGLGWLLAQLISWIGIPMPAPPGMSVGFTAEILVTPKLMGLGFLIAFIATTLATVYPAVKAARHDIVDALRHNR